MERIKNRLEGEVIKIMSQANNSGGRIDGKAYHKLSDKEIKELLATVSSEEVDSQFVEK